MSFPRYERYEYSGVKWLGDVPEGWEMTRLKFVATVQTGVAKGKDNTDKDTVEVPYLRVANVQDGYLSLEDVATIEIPVQDLQRYSLKKGDVLMNEGGDFDKLGRGHVWQGEIDPCIHQNHVFAVRSITITPNWLNTVTGSNYAQFYFMTRSKQSTNLASISSANVMELPVVLPPETEQSAILAFVDAETTKIDTLVSEQERLIELLKEKRQVVISHAVTKGLNPDVPMKDSGVEWLGEVPMHWDVIRLANIFEEINEEGNDELPFLSVSIHNGISDRELDENEVERKVTRSEDSSKYKKVKFGDLVYNMMRAWQGAFGTAMIDGKVSPAYVVARPLKPIATPYLELLLRIPQAIEEIRRYSRGVTDFRLRLYWDEFKDIRVVMPPRAEADAICERIATMGKDFSEITEACRLSISLLQERRSALISAAVTGKIDVRGFNS